jgi:uncharacterized protein (UPF0332 family)
MNIMSPQDLILKANRAIESAQLLRNAGDIDGACNRAYYAMFDAAKAALLKTIPGGNPTVGKTHSGLISAFGVHLVKTGLVPAEFGRAFNRAHDIRQVADYTGDLIEADQVDSLITQASEFVAWINSQVISVPD